MDGLSTRVPQPYSRATELFKACTSDKDNTGLLTIDS